MVTSDCGSDRVVCVGGTSDPPYFKGGCDGWFRLVRAGRKITPVGVQGTPAGAGSPLEIRWGALPAERAGSHKRCVGSVWGLPVKIVIEGDISLYLFYNFDITRYLIISCDIFFYTYYSLGIVLQIWNNIILWALYSKLLPKILISFNIKKYRKI